MIPNKFDLVLIYNCQCNTPLYIELEQAKNSDSVYCGFCQKNIPIRRIKRAKVLLDFFKEDFSKKAYEKLKSSGFSLKEIKGAGIQANSLNEFIKRFLESRKP